MTALILVGGLILIGVLGAWTIGNPSGSNPNLTIDNQSPREVKLHITAKDDRDNNTAHSNDFIHNQTLTVGETTTRNISIFEMEQPYQVTVTGNNQTISFSTRPICHQAETTVKITELGRLTYRVEFCEGLPEEGPPTSNPNAQ
jgi:hypothetical protein